jgi:hypothetical protein
LYAFDLMAQKRGISFCQNCGADGDRVFGIKLPKFAPCDLLILPVFALRKHGDSVLIRPISARYRHKKEVESHEKSYPDV